MSIFSPQQQKCAAGEEFRQRTAAIADEVAALCPKCKTFETLWFTNGRLVKAQKFRQEDGGVYHNCGSNKPCLLYRVS
jgi:ABC-type sulfate transport system substrate-binding protein